LQRVICGLGNPGNEYTGTRHNLGFMVVDRLSERWGVALRPGQGEFYLGEKDGIVLLRPTTFMNLSGIALVQFMQVYRDVEPKNLMVVLDDMDIPFGYIRLRKKGGSAGHKGLESIIYHLGTEDFPRLRIGIGKPDGDPVDYVLSPFTDEEREKLPEILELACDAVELWVSDGIDRAMSVFNKRVKEEL